MEGGGDCRRTARSPVKREYPKEEGRWEPAPGGEGTPTPPDPSLPECQRRACAFRGWRAGHGPSQIETARLLLRDCRMLDVTAQGYYSAATE